MPLTCSEALAKVDSLITQNEKIKADFDANTAAHNIILNKNKKWRDCYYNQVCVRGDEYGDYGIHVMNDLRNESKIWNSCVTWDEANRMHAHDDYCTKEFGTGWVQNKPGSGSGCLGGFGKGVCGRSDYKVIQDFQTNMLIDKPEPIDSKFPQGVPNPVYPDVPDISCCQQIDATAQNNAYIADNTQQCIFVNSAGQSLATTSPVTTTPGGAATTTSNLLSNYTTISTRNIAIWSVIIIVIICILFYVAMK